MAVIKVCKFFDDLIPSELYGLLRLRSEVFVVEQNCVFLDMDDLDQQCYHLLFYRNNHLAAYARLLPPGLYYPEMSIGRIITSPSARGTGLGKELVQTAIEGCYTLFGNGPIRIGAQLYAQKFYEQFGFAPAGDIYDEDGINHLPMLKV
ncbi:MAG: N-acetyltransferase ElaA [uncultured Adhaeribacter sp.]|uniref:N-acetyltransferase ElaA n=1 Tax=uncultured Adhaeribacter sp. TaxID=448109 RepID=A0A6J4IYL4_9BACT|nr:MAG: N-acetyltransferase ElaA [uncultured Adhaeribacter sp.]